MQGLKVSEIWIYPIKSLGGIRLTSAKVIQKGLQYDRRWMLVDEQNGFLTQRVHHQMALFKLSVEKSGFTIVNNENTFSCLLKMICYANLFYLKCGTMK